MSHLKIIIFLFLLNTPALFSKPINNKKTLSESAKKFKQAEALFKNESFSKALVLYTELFNADQSNSNLCYKIGICYLKIKEEKEKAVYYLEKAIGSVSSKYDEGSFKEKNAPLLTYNLLGQAYHQHYKFDLAIESYLKFKKILASRRFVDFDQLKEINRQIEMCYNAKKLIASPVNVMIENMGITVNSAYPDYAPVFTADQATMIFTSARATNVGGKTYNGGKYFEDIYKSTKIETGWSKAVNIGSPINTVDNEASVCISADGQEILIYKDDLGDGNIYSTTLNDTAWTIPVKLNSNINSKSWEPSAFIAANGRTLFFVSDRPGGFGGRDIYKSNKDLNGEWGKAVNLGAAINSKYDEDAPFLHPDGVTLYFSSNGHETMGGFDVFESTLSYAGNWSKPNNVGYPINSPGDDVFYVVSPDKKIAYFTSMRDGGYGEKDNYIINFPDVKEPPITLQKGSVLDNNKLALKDLKITITDNKTEEVVGVYHPNTSTGNYLFILTPGKSHNISYEAEGFMLYSENRYVSTEDKYKEITKSINLVPIALGSKVVLNNIFFDFDKALLRSSSNSELNRLYNFLIKHPALAIEIIGYTDSRGNDNYNLNLSMERAMAVIYYLTAKGIDKSRMVADGCGESDPISPNTKINGQDFPDGRKLNRRVELKIINIK